IEAVQHHDRPVNAGAATVDTVVIGGDEYVEPEVFQSQKQLIGGAKLGIAFIWLARKRYLQISDREVNRLDIRLHILKARFIIVSTCLLVQRIRDLRIVLHHVTEKKQ